MAEDFHDDCIVFDSESVQHAGDLQGNPDAILRQGLMEYFWIARRDLGIVLLTRILTEGSVEFGYLCACYYCVITKTKCKGLLKCLKLSILLERSKGARRSSQIFSGSGGWMRDLRI
ncbi:hypothetical protein AHAS_Ahas11G0213600 [Arachis hypogaea]